MIQVLKNFKRSILFSFIIFFQFRDAIYKSGKKVILFCTAIIFLASYMITLMDRYKLSSENIRFHTPSLAQILEDDSRRAIEMSLIHISEPTRPY